MSEAPTIPPTSHPSAATENTESRIGVSDAAAELLRTLTERHGDLIFHQSGPCCDGSSPMCFPDGDLIISDTGDATDAELEAFGLI